MRAKKTIQSAFYAALLLSFCAANVVRATSSTVNNAVTISDSLTSLNVSDQIKILKDTANTISLSEILSHRYDEGFGENHLEFLSQKTALKSFWTKLPVVSELKRPATWKFKLDQYLGVADLYIIHSNGKITQQKSGFQVQMKDRSVRDVNASFFNLVLIPGDSLILYVHVIPDPMLYTSSHLSASLMPESVYVNYRDSIELNIGIYIGFCILTIIYSLLFYFTVRDRNFLLLAGVVFFVMAEFGDAYGIVAENIFPNYPWYYVVRYGSAFLWLPGMVIFYQLFSSNVLDLKTTLPKTNIFLWAIVVMTIITGVGTGMYALLSSFGIILFFISILIVLIYLAFQGNRTAKFLFAANLFFLIGGIIASLGFVNILSGSITLHMALFGSELNLLILSIGITDRVRMLRLEKERAQLEAIKNLQEKDKLIHDQNIFLEQKVEERTRQLKETQTQLVQSEKLASLGQLTAGVAHEINNPINFVSANIGPLKRNMQELLKELDNKKANTTSQELGYLISETNQLLKGIEEGSRRTAEIVRGLRNFARADEAEIKLIDIHEGLESSLLLLNNKLNYHNIEIIKFYGALPLINAYPHQLNQVFMNLFTNAVDAIGSNGKIFITTYPENQHVKISIRDTGKGMSEEVKKKIFDPFFTTKEVGKGTGLGLSISYGIIEKHKGKIEVISEEGKGTEFIITLPVY